MLGNFNGHVVWHIAGFDGVHGGYGVGQRNSFRMGENETEIDFVLIKNEHRQLIHNMKAIPGEFQHALVVAGIDKK